MWINKLSLENTSSIFLSRKLKPRISQYFCVLWYFRRQSLSKWFSAVPSTVLIFTGQNTSFAQILTALLYFILLSHCLSHQEERKKLWVLQTSEASCSLFATCHFLLPTQTHHLLQKNPGILIQFRQPKQLSIDSAQLVSNISDSNLFLSFYIFRLLPPSPKPNTEPMMILSNPQYVRP